jgi:hypothetical protein
MSIKLIDSRRMINLMQGYRLTFEFDTRSRSPLRRLAPIAWRASLRSLVSFIERQGYEMPSNM